MEENKEYTTFGESLLLQIVEAAIHNKYGEVEKKYSIESPLGAGKAEQYA